MQLPQQLYKRKKDSHKKDFGHLLILAGSVGMTGAAVLAARAALRSGVGLVTLGLPESLVSAVVPSTIETMVLPLAQTPEGSLSQAAFGKIKEFLESVDALLVGPGLSKNAQTQDLIRNVVLESRIRTLIDADGINAWVGHLDKFKVSISCLSSDKQNLKIMTPHPGEMARLLDAPTAEVQNRRSDVAKNFSKEYNIVTVLKGYQTVVCDPFGGVYINKTGNSGMSTAGSGDVLSGVISAFWAQGLSSFEAAKFAVYIHGLAGDLAAREKTQLSLIASDIIDHIPQAIKSNIK